MISAKCLICVTDEPGIMNDRSAKLWAAVIIQAAQDATKQINPKWWNAHLMDLERKKAIFWLFKSTRTSIGSLPWICKHLDIDIERFRNRLKGFIEDGNQIFYSRPIAGAKRSYTSRKEKAALARKGKNQGVRVYDDERRMDRPGGNVFLGPAQTAGTAA